MISSPYPLSGELSKVNGNKGFQKPGSPTQTVYFAKDGYSVSTAGDFNGDGLDDIIIGAPYLCEW